MIEVSHVSRYFGDFRAVDDVSFSIPTGQIVGLLGPNGAGKTTTMRMITGFLGMTAGAVKIDGEDIAENPVSAKRKIGYMPESAPLYSEMIVEDYLNYVAEIQGAEKDKVSNLCDVCGLKEVMSKNIAELSRGYRQRVGLAHALMNDPEILILDEPTSGLDPNQISDVRSLIKEIGKTRTVIISTHILSEVEMLCDRVIIIAQGKLVADSPTSSLRERYANSMSLNLTVANCNFEQLQKSLLSVDGVASVVEVVSESAVCATVVAENTDGGKNAVDVRNADDNKNAVDVRNSCELTSVVISIAENCEIRPAVFALCAKNSWTIFELTPIRNSLEDVFKILTTSDSDKEEIK